MPTAQPDARSGDHASRELLPDLARTVEAIGQACVNPSNAQLHNKIRSGALSEPALLRQIVCAALRRLARRMACARGLVFPTAPARAFPLLPASLWPDIDLAMLSEAQWNNIDVLLLPHEHASPLQLSAAFEALLEMHASIEDNGVAFCLRSDPAHERRRSGAYYTPRPLVEHILDTTLDPVIDQRLACTAPSAREAALLSVRVLDPACGTGHFLAAAADRLAQRLVDLRTAISDRESRTRALRDVVSNCICGVELNPIALELCKLRLWFDLDATEPPWDAWQRQLCTGDAIMNRELMSTLMGDSAPLGFDAVIGNPPFLSQLNLTTVRTRGSARRLRTQTDGTVRGYADTAAAFLVQSIEWLRSDGRLALVQPLSFLAARDAAPVRRALLRRGSLTSLWVSNEHVFKDASVYTCVPTITIGAPRTGPLRRTASIAFDSMPPLLLDNDALALQETWGPLAAPALNIPHFTLVPTRTLVEIASATADFRDQYYGLKGFIVEDADLDTASRADIDAFPRLVTTGLIDLAACQWGKRATRFLHAQWQAPRIDRARMDMHGELGSWMATRLVPKILLATQTRVLEVFVDAAGNCIPSTPLITVSAHRAEQLWHLAAALASPVCTAWAMLHFAGTALHANAIKLSAKQVLTLPLPQPGFAWDNAAHALQAAHAASSDSDRRIILAQFAQHATDAYGLRDHEARDVMTWWTERAFPVPRSSDAAVPPASQPRAHVRSRPDQASTCTR